MKPASQLTTLTEVHRYSRVDHRYSTGWARCEVSPTSTVLTLLQLAIY